MTLLLLCLALAGPVAAATDPYRPQQWNLDRIGAPSAWDETTGRGEVIAVVDSGVDLRHPDLVDRFVRTEDGDVLGRDVVGDDDRPEDRLGHGTMVAGIAAATRANDEGIAGVSPRVRLLPVRVLDREGRGTASDVDEGIRWAVDNGATVINLSLESATGGDGDSPLGRATVAAPVQAVEYAWDHGVVVVAAAGNSGNGFTDYPRSSHVVLVGATDRDDRRAEFSDNGRDDLLMAPGVEIVSTWCREGDSDGCSPGTHTYGIADGTSFAAPHVAGALALLRSAGLDHEQAVDRLRRTARDIGPEGRDAQTGFGLVDVAAAMRRVVAARSDDSDDASPPAPSEGGGNDSPQPSRSPAPPPSREPSPQPPAPEEGQPAPEQTPPPEPAATSTPSPQASTSDPTEQPDDTQVTVPDNETAPIAAADGRPEGRTAWVVLAFVLLLVSASAVGRAQAREGTVD